MAARRVSTDLIPTGKRIALSTTPARTLDTQELEQRVKHMYQEVALEPEREFHFETGRALAERLGYPAEDLSLIHI